jgi:hypothetical protein
MDASILQLFSAEEILRRLTQIRATGCFHVFTPRESANIFFEDGVVVAAAQGQLEGEDVLKQILEWKDTRCAWQPDAVAPIPPLKSFHIDIGDLLGKPVTKTIAKAIPSGSWASPMTPAVAVRSRSARTGPIEVFESGVIAQADMAATRNMRPPTAEARASQEEALLRKHNLMLVSVEHPDKTYKLAKISNLIGRNPACDIAIPHPSISRQHCLLQITDRGLHVKDLDTTNGTTINGIALREGYINIGDKLTTGNLGFILQKAE